MRAQASFEREDLLWAEVLKLYDAGEVDKLAEKYEVADMLCIGDEDAEKEDAAEDETADDVSEEKADDEALQKLYK